MAWQPDDDETINGARRAPDGRFIRPLRDPYRTDGWEPVPPTAFEDRARMIPGLLRRAAKGDPREALRAIHYVRALTDYLEYEAVALARGCGWSWQAVGEGLGITRSAAQRRHARDSARVRRRRPST